MILISIPVLMILGVWSHAHAITRLKQSWEVGKTEHIVQCTDTKATLSGLQITLLPHTPCSFKECHFPHTTILQTICTVIGYEKSNCAQLHQKCVCLVVILQSLIKYIFSWVFRHFLARNMKKLDFKQLFAVALYSLYYDNSTLLMVSAYM